MTRADGDGSVGRSTSAAWLFTGSDQVRLGQTRDGANEYMSTNGMEGFSQIEDGHLPPTGTLAKHSWPGKLEEWWTPKRFNLLRRVKV